MEDLLPRGFKPKRIDQLLAKISNECSPGKRVDILSHHFLGHPYKSNPLIGSADSPEVFTASLDGFDCVTYIETVLALARSSNADEFAEWLRRIRYERGEVRWKRRNHYSTGWIRNNVREGIIKPVSVPDVTLNIRERLLNVVPGLPVRLIRVKCIPKNAVSRLAARLQSGDLIFFASTRKNLDVFHTGIIVLDHETMHMRHASRSKGQVVEQELSEFLKANRMAGVIVVRPQGITEHIANSN